MNPKAMYQLSYGLFALTSARDGRDNGCIVNTVMQVTSSPNRISVAVNKQNYTHDLIMDTGIFNVSVLTTQTPFSVFQRFGFQSGKDTDKFAGFPDAARTENGLLRLSSCANAYLSGKVVQTFDLGTHTMFLSDVTDGDVLSSIPSVTYSYYQSEIKPKPQEADASAPQKKGFRCTICGYVYEGDELPADFICPICKHGAADFEPIG